MDLVPRGAGFGVGELILNYPVLCKGMAKIPQPVPGNTQSPSLCIWDSLPRAWESSRDFMLLYKGKFDHWIGLRRDLGQSWKWANGTEFNNLFPITADGDCAYLTENSVSSLRCTSERYWICTKPDPFTRRKGTDNKGIVEISPGKTLL
uniref:C-type lectin domain-containing protein n=1 Tax=Gopherus agassizii TaxID=38772 RepID=A0A452ICI0_9SAUR